MTTMTRRIALLAALAAVVGGAGAAGAATAPAARLTAPHRAAIATAQNLLAGLPLPSGSAPASPRLTGDGQALRQPFDRLFFAAQAARHRFWTAPGSPLGVIDWVRAHLPSGARWSGTASSGSAGSAPSEALGSYLPAPTPGGGLLARLVSLTAVSDGAQETLVRADAFVQYISPRPGDERIAGRARELDITIEDEVGHRLGALTVTRRGAVRRLAAAVDALPVANFRGVAFSCPADLVSTPIDRLVFRTAPSAPPFASITIPSGAPSVPFPCYDTPLRVSGHRVGDVFDGGTVLALADRLLGLRLARR